MATDFVNLSISNNLSSGNYQKKFPLSTSIGKLKGNLELITGANSLSMKLELLDSQSKLITTLNDDTKSLADYNVDSNMTVHVSDAQRDVKLEVINTDPSITKGQYDDSSLVEKYEMSKEEYMKRGDSLLAFKEKMKLGRFADANSVAQEKREEKEREEKELVSAISVGSRCEVTVGKGTQPKRGVVKYVGLTDFKEGYWVGVQYDEPLGKNDGSVNGKRYFDCPMKYGAFVKPSSVSIGDYPPETFSDDDEM